MSVMTLCAALLRFLCLIWRGWLRTCRVDRPRSDHAGWRRRIAKSHIPYLRAPAKPPWVSRELIRLKARMPQAGCRVIAHTFNRIHVQRGERVSKSYVAEVVRRHRYAIDVERRRIKHRVPTAQPRNQVWAMDLTGKSDKGNGAGRTHHILGLIDHGSRALLDLQRVGNKCSFTLLGHLFLAVGKYGKPATMRTDNEAVFVSQVFRWGLRLAGIRHQRSDVGCPWQNGRIERVFGTLKQSLDQVQIDTGVALDGLLTQFRFFYNHVRPHQHLFGATPAEVWTGTNWQTQVAKSAQFVSVWDGMLTGYWLRR